MSSRGRNFGPFAGGSFPKVLSALLAGLIIISGQGMAFADETAAPSSSDASTTGSASASSDPSPSAVAPTDTPSPSPSSDTPRSDYIVTFAAGTTQAQQQADLDTANAVSTDSVPALRMYSASLNATGVAALRANVDVVGVEADKVREVQGTPNDPSYDSQWALSKIGWDSTYGTVTPTGSATVAVLDTGVDATADLTGTLVAGASMLDGVTGTADPNGHGTAMASIVAAGTDNGTGIAGVGYQGVSVMPVKVLGSDGTGQDSDIVRGVVYAADHGADVILMSFSNPGRSEALQRAADYAWSKGVVLVAATGNDGSTTSTFPAGLAKVVGVSATAQDDTLWIGSNSGADTFLGAPGVDIASGAASVTGTSASAAIAAGAAALVKANDPSASNGVVVGRLARNADVAGPVADTGNGRVNLARALGDSSVTPVVPQGVVGNGGPIVGPYVAAAPLNGDLQGQTSPACTLGADCPWQTGQLTGWSELQTVPLRLFFPAGQAGATKKTFTISIDHSAGATAGLEGLSLFAKSPNVTVTGGFPAGIAFSASASGDLWNYTFEAVVGDANPGFITFNTRLRAGAHNFNGASLQVKGAGTLQFPKPGAAPGSPDLQVTKSALTAVSPGQVMTYTVKYKNAAVGATNGATGVQLSDPLPSSSTYVPNSCTATCSYDSLTNTLTWNLGSIAASSAEVTKTYQVTVDPAAANNSVLTNKAQILSAENDANIANNTASVTTTVFTPSIAGTVVDDSNGNGAVDAGETGLAGAVIQLYKDGGNNIFDASDVQVGASVTTDSSGEWAFTSGLVKGTKYFVVRTNPSGYASTNAVPETVATAIDQSTATKDTNDRLAVVLANVTGSIYSSNNFFLAQIAQRTTTTTLARPAGTTPSVYGDAITYTATVTSASGM